MTDNQLMRALGTLIKRRIKERLRLNQVTPKSQKPSWSKGANTTLVKRGALMRSIDFRVTGSNTVIITAGGAGVPYARIQHEGGVIRPKHGKYLAIPLCAKAAASTPRAFENTFVAKGIIWQKPPEGGTTNAKPIALYKLKKQVVIPARPYMYIDAADRDMISRQLLQYVAGELKKAIKN